MIFFVSAFLNAAHFYTASDNLMICKLIILYICRFETYNRDIQVFGKVKVTRYL